MATRLELQEELENIPGVREVYYQPPESVKLKYPCIIYDFSTYDVSHADNANYLLIKRYELTLIDKDSDSEIPDEIMNRFRCCSFDRCYVYDNLVHWVYRIYY